MDSDHTGHSFTHVFFGDDVYVKLDDFIFAFYKESSMAPTEELKNVFGGIAMSFETLKKKVTNDKQAIKEAEKQKKTWWGEIAWNSYNKKDK